MIATYLYRAVRSECAKLSRRSPIWFAIIPLAVLIPLGINFGIAEATESNILNGAGGMDTNNASYWILIFTAFILMAGGVSSLTAEFKDATIETVFVVQPRRWLLPVAKLIVFGALAVATAAATTFLVLWGFPILFPDIWGRADVFSPDGLQLLLTVPLYTFLISALGLGLSALIPKPGLVVMIVLLWKFGVEVFVTFVPGDPGLLLQQLSPFKNGELGVGQLATIESIFGGQAGSLLYFAAICLALFTLGTLRLSLTDPKGH